MNVTRVEALDINPLHWLGDAASAAIGDVWKAAMTGLWSAALWMIKLAFRIIDAFTTPDLSATGPMGSVLPTTLWIGAALAGVMMFVQLTVALLRRDGASMSRVLLGIGQFGLVWVGFLGLAAGFVTAAAGLERGILTGMLNAPDLSHINLDRSFPSQIGDITLATVLGILGLLVVIPAAFFYVLIMFVREAALIILVATAPIAAGGLISEIGKTWFWKTVRWFFSCLLISPMAALILGIGVRLTDGVITPPPAPDCAKVNCNLLDPHNDLTRAAAQANTAHAGMAVVGCIVIAIGACCPLILFRLLSFVEPGTASGAALRQSWSDAGGMSGLVGSSRGGAGPSAALVSGSDGRSGGETGAEAQTAGRLASAFGMVGSAAGAAAALAHRAADIGSDILGQAGVGAPGYALTPTDERGSRRHPTARTSSFAQPSGASNNQGPEGPPWASPAGTTSPAPAEGGGAHLQAKPPGAGSGRPPTSGGAAAGGAP